MGFGKSALRSGLVGLSKFMRLSVLKSLVGRDLYVVNYHSLADADNDPYINKNVYRSVDEFEKDLQFYRDNFNIIGCIELLDLIAGEKPIPKDSLIITFDDGLRVNYDLQVPILKKHNVTATFFLCSAFLDNRDLHYGRKANLLRQRLALGDPTHYQRVADYLSDNDILLGDVDQSLAGITYGNRAHLEQIARLVGVSFQDYLSSHRPYLDSWQIEEMIKSGFTIGAHSIDHPKYGELPLERQLEQTIESMQNIATRFGLKYKAFAFPYSDDALSPEFFKSIAPYVDLTFGMGGFVDDPVGFNIQRGDVESTKLPAEHAVKYRLLLAWLHKMFTKKRHNRA